jgi:hypothetical protein
MQTYCERCGPGLFDEPINAFSNVVFLIAAFAAWRSAQRYRALDAGLWVLIGLSVCVGVGSFLWHTFATGWAMVLDVVPILLFQLCFLWLYGRRVVGLDRVVVVALLVGFVALGLWLGGYREWLNGVLFYTPALVLAVAIGLYHAARVRREPYILAASALIFGVALTCRTIDLLVCRQFPVGTHFLWHVLNGVVVYLAMRGLIVTMSDRCRRVEPEVAMTPRGATGDAFGAGS